MNKTDQNIDELELYKLAKTTQSESELLKLYDTPSDLVKRGVIENKHAPLAVIEKALKHESEWIRLAVLLHPECRPVSIFYELANDPSPAVVEEVGLNPFAPRDLLEEYAKSESKQKKLYACNNMVASHEILSLLAKDTDSDIAELAKKRLEQKTFIPDLFVD